ncbi:trypsin-like serine protease [Amycolatopsis anabasis]|uniref:trypsin-like serine protease n=1 Tax=Amycolatopsis anabasis TaxID=1840409 RepID=UPI00131A7A0B|nr:trypsin-like serine protease [Amycolatopsis anabasis]
MANLYDEAVAKLPKKPHIATGDEVWHNTPWLAAVMYDAPARERKDHYTCAGALVHPEWVVSCGHGFTVEPLNPQDPNEVPLRYKSFKVRVGSRRIEEGGELRRVVQLVRHPEARIKGKRPWRHDIILLKLDKPVDLPTIRIDDMAAVVGDQVSFLGWPDGLKGTCEVEQLETTIIPPQCAKLGRIGVAELCAANIEPPGGAREGYSGGALVRKRNGELRLVALGSRGAVVSTESSGMPMIITDAVAHKDFVENVTSLSEGQEPVKVQVSAG